MSVLAPNCQFVSPDISHSQRDHNQHLILSNGWRFLQLKSYGFGSESRKSSIDCRLFKRREMKVQALSSDLSRPSTVEMETIEDCDKLDMILQQDRQRNQLIIIDWMANWCRKCIYLKPKLEKLAAEYDTNKIKFYYVDVNNVPQALVKRGNISLWEDGEMKAEVLGGQKAYIVINEVREMIQQYI